MYIFSLLMPALGFLALSQLGACSKATPPSSSSSPEAQCTTTVTSTMKFGCTITEPAHTATQTIDCDGCAMTTASVPQAHGAFGHGPVCFNTRKTMLDQEATATAVVCGV